ncbi:MAG: tRNA 2-selenouridine(34) synthase MnmH [Pseudomonadota bacterium]
MAVTFPDLAALLRHDFDAVIDVRSPAEFAEDHVPGAINLPALSNEQRAEVGTIYVQQSPFLARKIGAAMVARNVADHLNGPLKDYDGGWRPLIYCWRGGQRSGSFASILTQIGWRAEVIRGGYQSFRSLVHATLYDTDLPHRIILLDGNTGTAKTDILNHLGAAGVQVIDLEGLANHRGSLLGDQPGGQPSQKAWETALATALAEADPRKPLIVEAESSKVGERIIPPTLWAAMKDAPRIEVSAPLEARGDYLSRAYADLAADHETLIRKLEILRRHRGALVDDWLALAQQQDWQTLATSLMEHHYDPTYRASRKRHDPNVLHRFEARMLDATGIAGLGDEIGDWISRQ